jgi:lactoylglutathione lyase
MVWLAFLTAAAAQTAPHRPRITGINHVAFYASDLPRSLTFWHGLLGYDAIDKGSYTVLPIDDHQSVELLHAADPHPPNELSHFCFATDDAAGMIAYLHAAGVETPAQPNKSREGDLEFQVKDPEGTPVEFIQLHGGDPQFDAASVAPGAISHAIYHVGFVVGNLDRAMDFYGRILGFQETWRGSPNPNELSWVNLRVPDGTDYVEFMLGEKAPTTAQEFGSKNHVALAVPDIAAAAKELAQRPAFAAYGKPLAPRIGTNRKRQLNLYDPDGTRVELMETNTVDGKPTPSSTAPPPAPWRP